MKLLVAWCDFIAFFTVMTCPKHRRDVPMVRDVKGATQESEMEI